MPIPAFVALFIAVWLIVVAYVVCMLRMGVRLYRLKKQGRFTEAPDVFHQLESFRAMSWLVSGRYGELDDPVIARWARTARILFLIAAPGMLLLFILGFGVVGRLP